MPPTLSVIIVNWNTVDLLRQALSSVDEHLRGFPYETIVVDNASADGSPEMVAREFSHVRLLRNTENVGFGRGMNVGMAAAAADLLLLLNSDAHLIDASLLELVRLMQQQPDLGVVGPLIRLSDGRVQPSAQRFPTLLRLCLSELWLHRFLSRAGAAAALLGDYWSHDAERSVDWLVGACWLTRRAVFEQTGGFDPQIFLYGEELEWARRIHGRGWRLLFTPRASVVHLNHGSADQLLGTRGRVELCLRAEDQLLSRWHGRPYAWLAQSVRRVGARLRLMIFGAKLRFRPDDRYARDVCRYARSVLDYYRAPPRRAAA